MRNCAQARIQLVSAIDGGDPLKADTQGLACFHPPVNLFRVPSLRGNRRPSCQVSRARHRRTIGVTTIQGEAVGWERALAFATFDSEAFRGESWIFRPQPNRRQWSDYNSMDLIALLLGQPYGGSQAFPPPDRVVCHNTKLYTSSGI